MRILWYSLSKWFSPSVEKAEVIALLPSMSDEELAEVRGSSEIAYKHGMKIKLVKGEEANFKITTKEDLDKFRAQISDQ